jgi:cytochrome c553
VKADIRAVKADIRAVKAELQEHGKKLDMITAKLANSVARSGDTPEVAPKLKGEKPPAEHYPATWDELRTLSDPAIVALLAHYENQRFRAGAAA